MKGAGMYELALWGMNYPNSYTAYDPEGSSERIGKLLLRLRAEKVAEVYKIYKESDELVEWNEEYNSYLSN